MSKITPLLCTTWGSQLKSTADQDRFVCSNCRTEYLVERHITPAPVQVQSKSSASTPPRGKQNTASVLLELLDQMPDAKKLDTLLDTGNLLKLLLLYGWNDQDLKQQLASGKIPGEFLLELLEREPNPDVLLARLGKSAKR